MITIKINNIFNYLLERYLLCKVTLIKNKAILILLDSRNIVIIIPTLEILSQAMFLRHIKHPPNQVNLVDSLMSSKSKHSYNILCLPINSKGKQLEKKNQEACLKRKWISSNYNLKTILNLKKPFSCLQKINLPKFLPQKMHNINLLK